MTLTTRSLPLESADSIPASIFRAYDIRGIAGEQLHADSVRQISQAIGSEALACGIKTLLVGCDGRLSSPELSAALVAGLLSTGCDVINLGQIPTPLLYFATHTSGCTSGVMLTASHNPAQYNGLKIVFNRASLPASQIRALHTRLLEGALTMGAGSYSERDIVPAYLENVRSRITLKRPLKVVIDCANAVAGKVAPPLFAALGCDIVPLFCELDGRFPNHDPDPTVPANLRSLAEQVVATGADLGLAFDGDADRIAVVTDRGEIIAADRLLMLLVQDIAKDYPGAPIIFDVKCSKRLPALIQSLGLVPVMHRSGHSYMKQKMQETQAPLGGEFAAHIFLKDRWYGFDDGLYAGARVVEILSRHRESAQVLFDGLVTDVSTPEISVPVAEDRKFGLMDRIVAAASFPDATLITIDGLRVEFADGWGLVRASNTSPALLLRFEAQSAQALASIQDKFKALIGGADKTLRLDF